MNANKILYSLNTRVKELTRRINGFKEAENYLIELTGYDFKQLQALFAAGYTLEPPEKETLILRSVCYMNPEQRQAICDHIKKQMEYGVLVIPYGFEVIRVPAGVEVKVK